LPSQDADSEVEGAPPQNTSIVRRDTTNVTLPPDQARKGSKRALQTMLYPMEEGRTRRTPPVLLGWEQDPEPIPYVDSMLVGISRVCERIFQQEPGKTFPKESPQEMRRHIFSRIKRQFSLQEIKEGAAEFPLQRAANAIPCSSHPSRAEEEDIMRALEARFCQDAYETTSHEQMELTMGLPMCEWLIIQMERHPLIKTWMDKYSIMWEDIDTILATTNIDAKFHAVIVFDEDKQETRLWFRGTLRTPVRVLNLTPKRRRKEPPRIQRSTIKTMFTAQGKTATKRDIHAISETRDTSDGGELLVHVDVDDHGGSGSPSAIQERRNGDTEPTLAATNSRRKTGGLIAQREDITEYNPQRRIDRISKESTHDTDMANAANSTTEAITELDDSKSTPARHPLKKRRGHREDDKVS
jgi:hypothetical protein